MKLWATLLLFIFTVKIGLSQDNHGQISKFFWTNDTVIKKGQKFRLSNVAIQVGAAGAKLFHDKQTEKYLGNYSANSSHVNILYKNILLGFNIKMGSLNINDTLKVVDENVSSSTELILSNIAVTLGYNITLIQNLSATPYIGLLNSSFNSNNYSNTQSSTGFTAGLSLNKYFTLQPKRLLGIFINGSYNQSNYQNWNTDLGKYFYAVDIGIEYKFWILKKIK